MRAVAMLLGIGGLWGLSFTLSRIIVAGGAHPLTVAFWHAALGFGLLAALGRRPRPDRAHLAFCVVAGLTGTALPSVLVLVAAREAPAGVLSLCMALAPILCLTLCAALGVERFSARRVAGLAAGVAAVAIIAGPQGAAPLASVALAAAAAASYALEQVFIAVRRPPGSDAFSLLAGMQAAAALMLGPALLLWGAPLLPLSWPMGPAEGAFFLMLAGNLLAYGGFVALIGRAGPVFASQVAYVVIACGVGWGALVLGERHSGGFWLGLGLMAVGLALSLPRRPPGASPARA